MDTSEGERLVKLALFVAEHAPVSFTTIREHLHEYAFYEGDDADERRRHDVRVRRMFERDKGSLESCGVFLESDADNRYSLDRSASFAAPVDLSAEQASLLRLTCAALLEDESYPLKGELRMVLAKIGDELGVPDLLPGVGTGNSTGNSNDSLPAGFKKVRRAIDARKRLSFEYRNAKGVASTREVEPFGCFFLRGHCYVIAFDPDAGSERNFRLDRMSRLKVNGARVNTPDFPARSFDAHDWYRLPFQFGPRAERVTVDFGADSAWRAERLSMGFGEIEEREDGGVRWRVEACDLDALASWCVENGPGVAPLDPPEARAAYRKTLEGALEACS